MVNVIKLEEYSLRKYNTLGLESKAACIYFPLNVDGMIEAIEASEGKKRVILGNGSNILLTKDYYDDSTVFIITQGMDTIELKDNEIYAEAGGSLNRLAWYAIEQSIDGYAFCEDIPGSVGGALIMNAGQYEFTISQYTHWIDVYDTELKAVKRIIPDENFFGYRRSSFKSTEFILSCGLRNVGGDDLENLERVLNYKRERYRKQPRNYPNAGSVFKRPVKNGETLFVWKLFEACGLRGHRLGGAEVSFKHPGFIVNADNASIEDVMNLIEYCKKLVKDQFDIDLELEWKVID